MPACCRNLQSGPNPRLATSLVPPHPPHPTPPRPTDAGLPEILLPPQLRTEYRRQPCPDGTGTLLEEHGEVEWGIRDPWVGLTAKEQYCGTKEYYEGRHQHCQADIARYYSKDLALLYGPAQWGQQS